MRIGRILRWVVGLLALGFVGFAIWVRMAPDDPAIWHVDPETAVEAGLRNDFIVRPGGVGADLPSPVYAETPEALLADVRALALSEPRTELLSDADGFLTFVARSRLMGYPDYVSVKAVAVEGGSALFVHSRSRYGRDDFGVNAARVSAWLSSLEAQGS